MGGVGPQSAASQVAGGSTLPATPTFRSIFAKPDGLYICLSNGTWTLLDVNDGDGTVTSVSVVSANGQSGSVANASTTPAITLNNPTALVASTSVTTPIASLGTASSVTGQLRLAHASSAHLTTLSAGNAAAARTYVWPTNFGAAGTVLKDAAGDGILSWGTGGITNSAGANNYMLSDGTNAVEGSITKDGSTTDVAAPFRVSWSNAAASFSYTADGPNAELRFTAVTVGVAGNSIEIETFVDGANDPLSISVVGTVITVFLASDGDSNPLTTALELRNALNADDDANDLITTTLIGGSDGSGIISNGGINDLLSGGVDAGIFTIPVGPSIVDGQVILYSPEGVYGEDWPPAPPDPPTSFSTLGITSQLNLSHAAVLRGALLDNSVRQMLRISDNDELILGDPTDLTLNVLPGRAGIQFGDVTLPWGRAYVDTVHTPEIIDGTQIELDAPTVVIQDSAFTPAAVEFVAGLITIRTSGGTFSADTPKIAINATVTPAATTGAQTINKSAGSVNFAAGASTLVVTNTTVTASSIILCTVATNDTTATIKNCVASTGSFTITLTAAATAETRVNFWVISPQ